MSARVGLTPEEYAPLLKGTHLLTLAEAKEHFKKAPGLASVYGSSTIVDAFNVANKVYEKHQVVDDYFDPSIVESLP